MRMKQKTDAILKDMIVFCTRNTRRSRFVSLCHAWFCSCCSKCSIQSTNLLGH